MRRGLEDPLGGVLEDVAELLLLLPQLVGPLANGGLDDRVVRLGLGAAGGNLLHLGDSSPAGSDQENVLEDDPTGVLDRSPVVGQGHAKTENGQNVPRVTWSTTTTIVATTRTFQSR